MLIFRALLLMAVGLLSSVSSTADVISLDVLPCGRPGEAGGLAGGTDLYRMVVDTARYPNAICNDGSPAVFYIRRYSIPDNRNKWHIQLQGGGACGSGQSCAERWCSANTNFGMDKMTSSLSKPSIRATGILSPNSESQFATWNHVLIYYCSSDSWTGRAHGVDLEATQDSGSVNYMIYFQGADVVDSVFDILSNPTGRIRPVRREPGSVVPRMPDLDDATDVLISGSSAGGGGVKNNGDRLAALLRTNNVHCAEGDCPLDVRLLLDSTFFPAYENIDYASSVFCMSDPEKCDYEGFIKAQNDDVNVGLWQWSTDDSCLAYHGAVERGDAWRCADGTHIMQHHVTTPMMVGQDLQDQLLAGNFTEFGFGDLFDFGSSVRSQLLDLEQLDQLAEEGSAHTGIPLVRPATFGSQCQGHENLGNRKSFYDVKVEVYGVRYSYHDVVWNWWSGALPSNVVQPFQQRERSPVVLDSRAGQGSAA